MYILEYINRFHQENVFLDYWFMGYNEFFYKICLSILLVFSIIEIVFIGGWEIFGSQHASGIQTYLFLGIPFAVAILSMTYLLIRIWKYKGRKR